MKKEPRFQAVVLAVLLLYLPIAAGTLDPVTQRRKGKTSQKFYPYVQYVPRWDGPRPEELRAFSTFGLELSVKKGRQTVTGFAILEERGPRLPLLTSCN
jgi:hypothetical protein